MPRIDRSVHLHAGLLHRIEINRPPRLAANMHTPLMSLTTRSTPSRGSRCHRAAGEHKTSYATILGQ